MAGQILLGDLSLAPTPARARLRRAYDKLADDRKLAIADDVRRFLGNLRGVVALPCSGRARRPPALVRAIFTLSQSRSHFFCQVKRRWQTAHVLLGRWDFCAFWPCQISIRS